MQYRFPRLIVEENLWIGTPRGLYQYHADEDTWAIYGEHTGLPSNQIQILQYDGEFLWVITPGGISAGDIRLNKWLTYTKENGLPSNTVLCIGFQEDYVWIGTDRGAARFDKLIQEWEWFRTGEGLPDSTVRDLVVDGDLVYFATDRGLAEYDVNFEKWRTYPIRKADADLRIRYIYPTTEFLWLFTDEGPVRFSKELRSTQSFFEFDELKYAGIRDLVVDAERFWAATSNGVLIYDPDNNLWRHFQEEVHLPDLSVRAMAFDAGSRWFATDRGVAVFDEKVKSWQYHGTAQGLTAETYEAVAVHAGRTFFINEETVDYYMPQENRWRVYPLQDVAAAAGRKTPYVSLDQEKGSFVQFTPDVRLGLSGSRYTYQYTRSLEYRWDTRHTLDQTRHAHRRDMKAQLTLPGGRTVNGFYDDTDFSQTFYGVRYKGKKGDLIQEVNWGDVSYEQGKRQILPSIGIFGSSARLEAGPKTERYGRSLVSFTGWSGEKTTGQETEFFRGNLRSGTTSIGDIDFIRNTFFRWDTAGAATHLDEGSERIYVDDGNSETNTANTMEGMVFGDITGDFDLLHPWVDYAVDLKERVIRLTKPVSETAAVVLRAASGGKPLERVLKTPDGSYFQRVNRYFVGAMEILPYSFRLEIVGQAGEAYRLSDFNIDGDHDGRVDPDWIDYRRGILSFPVSQPFPSSVYDPENPVSVYRMNIEYETELTTFQLAHRHLIRGSETVMVDGDLLNAGEDYVLDYTGGTLLILKQGVVAEDSEIEVRYDYYRDSEERFHLAGLDLGLSDRTLVGVHGFAFDPDTARGSGQQVKGVQVFGEFKGNVAGMDFKITPEFARSHGGAGIASSMHVRSDLSSQRVRVFSEFEKIDDEFQTLFPRRFQLGKMANRIAAGATVLPNDFLDISADWYRQQTPVTTERNTYKEVNVRGRVLLSAPSLPAVSLSIRHRTLDGEGFQSTKETVRGELDYQVPRKFLNKLSLKSMRLYGVWRRSREDVAPVNDTTALGSTDKTYDNHYVRFEFSPMNLVQINAYYRGESVKMGGETEDTGSPISRRQRWFLDATVDRIRGINMNLRYQDEVTEQLSPSDAKTTNVSQNRSFQSNIRFFPGQWVGFLNPFTFEFNYQPNWRGHLRNFDSGLSLKERFWRISDSDAADAFEDNAMVQFRGEWRPTAFLLFYTGIESYRIATKELDSELQTDVRRLHSKVEVRPSTRSLITMQYFQNIEETPGYSRTTRYNPMLWLENRWTESLQTKFNLTYIQEERRLGKLVESNRNVTPLLGLTYRIRKRGSRRASAEFRNDLSASFYRSRGMAVDLRQNTYSNALAIDVFPTSILMIRFRLTTIYRDELQSDADKLSTTMEVRLTAQF